MINMEELKIKKENIIKSEDNLNLSRSLSTSLTFIKDGKESTYNFENGETVYDAFEKFYEFPDRATYTITRSDEDKPFVHFVLDDTEASYPLFSLIWESAKEGNIHLYTFLGDESQIEHLGKFLKKYGFDSNIPNPLNIVTLDEAITVLQMTEGGGNSVWYDDDLDEARKELSED